MAHLRILLALIAGGLASPMLATPLEAALRHQTPDAPMLAYGLAPVIVAILAYGAGALFARSPDEGAFIQSTIQIDGRKVGTALTKRRDTDLVSDGRQ